MKFERLLSRSVKSLWATTYSFNLKLFDQYVMRRIAATMLNAVAFVDQRKLASVWSNLDPGDVYLARQAGSRYLLRGIDGGGGAFHPKTYLFGRAQSAT